MAGEDNTAPSGGDGGGVVHPLGPTLPSPGLAARAAAVAELRLAVAAQFAGQLAGFEQCVFWVDAGWPVFDEFYELYLMLCR